MHTREGALRSAPDRADQQRAPHLVGSMGQATLTALTALAGCLLLIGLGAAMSICWAVQPLLMIPAGIAVIWVASRLAGRAFRAGGRAL